MFAQTRTVTGSVKDGNGQVIPYASILIKGTNTGTTADADGKFKIDVQEGQSLIISAAGLGEQELKIGSAMTYDVILQSQGNLEEVVVTALGITRSKNTLPFAAQKVQGSEVSQSRNSNFVNNLSGKVAGLEIRQTNTMGGSTNVLLRGAKSLT
jgi:outer membrane receptor protein involved in Fe transport